MRRRISSTTMSSHAPLVRLASRTTRASTIPLSTRPIA
jgi:hypothetical protein